MVVAVVDVEVVVVVDELDVGSECWKWMLEAVV